MTLGLALPFPRVGSVKPRVMAPQSSVGFPKIDLKSPLNVQKHYKKAVHESRFCTTFPRVGSVKPRVMTSLKCNVMGKTQLKTAQNNTKRGS